MKEYYADNKNNFAEYYAENKNKILEHHAEYYAENICLIRSATMELLFIILILHTGNI